LRDTKETLARYDLGAAARAASKKGAALSADEMDRYRVDASTTILPRRVLDFDGERYSFAWSRWKPAGASIRTPASRTRVAQA
jgi:hypothetical protein